MPKKKTKQTNKTCFRVELTYPGRLYSDVTEEKIRKAGGYSHASGMGFGVRDHAWYFKAKKPATTKAAKLSRLKSIKGLKVKVKSDLCV